MTIEEAIQHHRKVAATFKDKDSEQLAAWLTELQEYRSKAPEKPKTNGDNIRSMTDEQLASMFHSNCAWCAYCGVCMTMSGVTCENGILTWLRKEVSKNG